MNASDDGTNENNNNNNENNNNEENNHGDEQRRKGKGRQKITMAKIENETNLQVTFSKRRAGVFKKASELSTLCGAESAVVVFSPGNKPHSFGHPNVEAVANRFLHASSSDGNNPPPNPADQLMMAHGEAAMNQRNHELIAIEAALERERQLKKELDEMARGNPQLNELTYEELEQMKKAVANFKREFEAKVQSNAAENAMWPANPSTQYQYQQQHQQQQQGLGFPVYGYGGSNIYPTIPGGGSSSFNYPPSYGTGTGTGTGTGSTSQGNFGQYTVQYPPFGPSGSNFNFDPAAGVPYYNAGAGTSMGPGTSTGPGTGAGAQAGNEADSDEDDNTEFDNIYRRWSS